MQGYAYSKIIPTEPGYYVYRCWAADGTCLYVGLIGERGPRRPRARFANHKRRSWWPQVAYIDIVQLDDSAEIIAEERVQIVLQEPIHNRNLRSSCRNGHDLNGPSARNADGNCAKCSRESGRKWASNPEVKARRAFLARARRRRSSLTAGQASLW